MIIGFTGSRKGLTNIQKQSIIDELGSGSPTFVVHGGCMGADTEFHQIALDQKIPIMIRPCTLSNQRGEYPGSWIIHDAEPPLVRNHKIVDGCDFLIAAPHGPEILRSGTWATIRYARKTSKRNLLV